MGDEVVTWPSDVSIMRTEARSASGTVTAYSCISAYIAFTCPPRSVNSFWRSLVARRNSEYSTNSATSSGLRCSRSCACDVSASSLEQRSAASCGSVRWMSSRQRCGDGRKRSLMRWLLPPKMPTVAESGIASNILACAENLSMSSRHSSSVASV